MCAGAALEAPEPSVGSSRAGSMGPDLKLWLIPFRQLELLKQIGEGSFGRVREYSFGML